MPCPVCSYPIRSDEDYELIDCPLCRVVARSSCCWRVLPLEEWVTYIRWVMGTDQDALGSGPDMIHAACRQFEGLGKGKA